MSPPSQEPTKPRPTHPTHPTTPSSSSSTPPTTPPPSTEPTAPAPTAATRQLTFDPTVLMPYDAQLRATAGWEITSVVDSSGEEHIEQARSTFKGRLPSGSVDVTVRHDRATERGTLTTRFTLPDADWLDLPGTGTYDLATD
ncbi:hypothetical protein [Luteipulveratus halotolerans]|uniref:hypothetical protein n=1 Tax=Luteipulveratus halotolerans TaxID=1631356 RepID=UPI000683245A|nr:hypothetical protein [Luteipulveratus halotolerans]